MHYVIYVHDKYCWEADTAQGKNKCGSYQPSGAQIEHVNLYNTQLSEQMKVLIHLYVTNYSCRYKNTNIYINCSH